MFQIASDAVSPPPLEAAARAQALTAWQSATLGALNAARSRVNPAAAPPLAPLAWSAGLASVAAAYTGACPGGPPVPPSTLALPPHNAQRSLQFCEASGGTAAACAAAAPYVGASPRLARRVEGGGRGVVVMIPTQTHPN